MEQGEEIRFNLETIWAPQILLEKDPGKGSFQTEINSFFLNIHLECVSLAEEAFRLLSTYSLPRPWVKGQLGKKIVWVCSLTALQK